MIYKYAPCSKYTFDNIRKCQVLCRHYSEFNDPFEFWSVIEEGEPHPKRDPVRYARALKAWGYDTDYDENVRSYFDEIKDYQSDFQHVFKGIRISCFSRDAANLLMWSHYADGLRGICLEFADQLLTADNKNAQVMDVNYTDKPGYVDTFELALAQDQIWYYEVAEESGSDSWLDEKTRLWTLVNRALTSAFATKPVEWRYEKECRLILQNAPEELLFHPYPAEALQRVIVGQRVADEDREQLEEAISVAGISVPISVATCMPDSYQLMIVGSDAA